MPSSTIAPQLVPQHLGNFDLIVQEQLEFADLRVAKWRSRETGLKVVHIDVEGPLIQGQFSVATEIHDDSGRPHCLEHLVFLGSEQFRYKGVLDTLANRMFANGTNAWTDTTNTTYTVGTAGQEGFLGILPVFLDHVLYPILTDSGFVTEVHNVNGKGEDSGVVYSEMQGRENGSGDLMQLRLQRSLFNKKSGYRSETGGLMEALRQLTPQAVRDYHGSAYLPHNLTLIVTGRSLSPTALLETLQKHVEPTIVAHGQNKGPTPPGWIRPFVDSTTATNRPVISENKREVVEFPERDESIGEVMVSWVGVGAKEFIPDLALEVLGEYLTESAVSPLYKEFVEIEEPFCTDITFTSSTADPSILTVYLSSVPTEHLATFDTQFKTYLARIASEGFDMTRMAMIIERQRLALLESIETDAAEVMSSTILADALFGDDEGSDLGPSMKTMSYYKLIDQYKPEDWSALLKKFYVDAPSITIVGQPSSALADTLEKEEKARVAETVARLGPEGLAQLAKKVTDAQAENDQEIPSEIISRFKVPDVNGVEWIKVESARSGGVAKGVVPFDNAVQAHIDADGAELPLFVQYDQINSNFIEISVHLFADDKAGAFGADLRSLLPVYLDSFFSLPVIRADGTKLDFEDVVRTLDAETLSYTIDSGRPLQEDITIRIKVTKDKYTIAIGWLRDLLWGSQFSAVQRLTISANKAIQNLPSEKRDGSNVAYNAYRQLVNGDESINAASNLFNRVEFLPAFVARLKDEPQAVVAQFEQFRRAITDPRAMRIAVKGDILSIDKPATAWLTHFEKFEPFERSELKSVILGKDVLSELGQTPARKVVVFGVSSIESCFGYHVARATDSPSHPDQPALTVARSVLNAMESYLWKYIRGAGLAYGASIQQDLESGMIYYSVYKSPDSHAAFIAAKKLIDELVAGEIIIDELALESAKSSLAYNTAAKESTMNDAANASFTTQVLLGLPPAHGRLALARTKDVSIADVLRVIKVYVQPIFDPATSIGSIAVGTAKVDEMAEHFTALGYDVEKRSFGDSGDDSEGSESGSETGSE